MHLGRGLDDLRSDLGLATNANGVVLGDLLEELLLRHCLGVVIDMEALGAETLDGLLGDVLEEEQAQVLVLYRVEDLWLPHVPGGGLGHALVQAGAGGGGDRGCHDGVGDGDGRAHCYE